MQVSTPEVVRAIENAALVHKTKASADENWTNAKAAQCFAPVQHSTTCTSTSSAI